MDKFVKKELSHCTQGTFRDFIVRWTVCDDQPFTAVETPSADTLHSDVIDKFNEERNNIREILQIIACTTNNASNNNTLMKALEKTCKDQNIEFTVYNNYIRCLTHIINLAAQDVLSTLKVKYVENENELLNNDKVSEVIPKKTCC
ncbi:hypothetical protein C1646_749688 [Rhizophagus diaphanus]|nr:hypothetical protein C1646_749688 [Rhizophagus diaphanus] [Rhizophagus sp. MUCL 43196]